MVDGGETDKNRLGLIVVDAKTTMYGTLSDKGNTREVLHEFVTDRPNRREIIREYQGRGGQSSLVLGRLRVKAFKDHIKKTAESWPPDFSWLILACAPGIKNFLDGPGSLDPRLLAKILNGAGGESDMSNTLFAKVLNAVGVCEEEMGFDLHKLAKIFDGLGVSCPCGHDLLFNPLLAKILHSVCGEEMGFDPLLEAKILNAVTVCGVEVGFDPRQHAKILDENSARVKYRMPFDPRLQAKILNLVGISCGGEKGFDEAIANISSV